MTQYKTGIGDSARRPQPRRLPLVDSWPAVTAALLAFAFAAVSFYWAAGGSAGLDTLGGRIEELARARDPALVTATWVTGLAKVACGVLALALVRPWRARLGGRLLQLTAWIGAAALIGYGLLQVGSLLLVALGLLEPAEPVEPAVLRWRLLLWEPWFLIIGLLLAQAARTHRRRLPRPE